MFFSGSRGQQLAYDLDLNAPESRDIAIVCHGMMCNRGFPIIAHVAQGLKINAFRFDFSGNGESSGEFTYSGLDQEAEELRDAVDFCRTQGYRVVAIIGHSKGARVTLAFAASYTDVPIIVLLAPRCNMQLLSQSLVPLMSTVENQGHVDMTSQKMHMLNPGPLVPAVESQGHVDMTSQKKEFRVTMDMIKERAAVDMEAYARRVQNWVMLIHCEEDEQIPVADAYQYQRVLGEKLLKLVIIPGGSHFFLRETDSIAIESINSFLAEMIPVVNMHGTT